MHRPSFHTAFRSLGAATASHGCLACLTLRGGSRLALFRSAPRCRARRSGAIRPRDTPLRPAGRPRPLRALSSRARLGPPRRADARRRPEALDEGGSVKVIRFPLLTLAAALAAIPALAQDAPPPAPPPSPRRPPEAAPPAAPSQTSNYFNPVDLRHRQLPRRRRPQPRREPAEPAACASPRSACRRSWIRTPAPTSSSRSNGTASTSRRATSPSRQLPGGPPR